MAIKDVKEAIRLNSRHFNEEELENLSAIISLAEGRELDISKNNVSSKETSLKFKERGNAEYKAGNFLEAIEHYTEGINRDPENEILYSNRAAAYAMLGIEDQGIEDCLKAIEINPKFSKAYVRLGDFYSKNDIEKSYKYYLKAKEIDPENKSIEAKINKVNPNKNENLESLSKLLESEEVKNIINSGNFKDILKQIAENDESIINNFKNLNINKK